MFQASIRFNPDGTARVTLVDSETNEPVPGFDWAAHGFRNGTGYVVQMEHEGTGQTEVVTVLGPEDMSGARDQTVLALVNKAKAAGYSVQEAVLADEQEPLP